MHVVAILMTIIMILHIRSKYTAVGASPSTNGLSVVLAHREAYTGRKEIVLFFYFYAIIEVLAFFMDSGIIPSAHVSYAVRDFVVVPNKTHLILNAKPSPPVVRRNLYRLGGGNVYLSADQRFCRIPICRGRNTVIIMGMRTSYW